MAQMLKEMATLANLQDGYGFIIIIHTNDHNPAHMHLYKSKEDVAEEKYYTRVLIPDNIPEKIKDIVVYDGDVELNSKEKRLLLKWFGNPYKKMNTITNFQASHLFWDTYQDES